MIVKMLLDQAHNRVEILMRVTPCCAEHRLRFIRCLDVCDISDVPVGDEFVTRRKGPHATWRARRLGLGEVVWGKQSGPPMSPRR